MKISVIVTAFNAEKTIKRAIDSILAQTHEDIEVIVINDASSDQTAGLLTHYCTENRLRVVHHDRNQGAGKSRLDGISLATGDYICTIDSDDWLEPNHLELLDNAAEQYHADIVAGGIIYDRADGSIDAHTFPPFVGHGLDILRRYFGNRVLFINNMLVRRELAQRITYSTRRYIEDTPTATKWLYEAGRVVYLPVATYHYTDNPASLCHTASALKTSLFCGLCALDLINYFEERAPFVIEELELKKGLQKYLTDCWQQPITRNDAEQFASEIAEFHVRASHYLTIDSTKIR